MRNTLLALTVALFSPLGFAQQPLDGSAIPLIPAPDKVLEAFSVEAGTIQDILVSPEVGSSARISVIIQGARRDLDLRAHSMFAHDFKLLVDDGEALREAPMPKVETYRGNMAGVPGTTVAATLRHGQIEAMIILADGTTWGIEPVNSKIKGVPQSTHIVYRKADVKIPADVRCDAGGLIAEPAPLPGGATPSSVLRRYEIACDADNAYYVRNGSSVANTQAAVTTILNAVDAIYQRDVEICMAITTIIVRTTRVYTSGPDLGCGASPGLLQEFRTRWNTNHQTVRRDVAHLFSGQGSFSGNVGCAFIGVICSSVTNGSGYGSSRAISANAATNTGLVAHEIGHNWSATHCNASPPCYIMCSSIGGCNGNITLFGTAAKNQILAHKNSRTCLDNCPSSCNPATAVNYGTACVGTVRSPVSCGSANTTATANTTTGWVTNAWFAHLVPASTSARNVTGAEFLCSDSTPRSVAIGLWTSVGGQPGTLVRSSTMSVTASPGFRGGNWASYTIPANTPFFIAYRTPTTSTFRPESATGTPTTYYWNGPPTWNGPFSTRRFAWKVRCTGVGNPLPPLISGNTPRIGQTWTVSLSQARPNSLSVIVFGLQRTAIPLPLTNSCFLYTNPVISFNANTSATGTRSVGLGIANNTAFCGAKLQAQYFVRDNPPGNTLGLVSTQGREGTVGN